MSIVPNEKHPLEALRDIVTTTDRIVFDTNPFNIDIDGVIYFLLILCKALGLPVIGYKLGVLLSFFIEGLFGIIDEHILKQVFPDLGSNA